MNLMKAKVELDKDYGKLMAVLAHPRGKAVIFPSGRSKMCDDIKQNFYSEWSTFDDFLCHHEPDQVGVLAGTTVCWALLDSYGMNPNGILPYDSWAVQGYDEKALVRFNAVIEDHYCCEKKVYFIAGDSLVKIGMSGDIERRMKDLSIVSPVSLRLLAIADGGKKYEQQLHKRFSKDRDHNEWYKLSDELWSVIRSHQGL